MADTDKNRNVINVKGDFQGDEMGIFPPLF
jgi:hypothetical protein